jgi:hypothetical protein
MFLADGNSVNVRVFDGTVDWFGTERSIQIVETDGDILLGFSMLYGHHLCIDVIDGGEVEISAIE